MQRGVVVGADEKMSWLLPWWYERYIAENRLPIFFVDFGMEQKSLDFCLERGSVVSLPRQKKSLLDPNVAALWERSYGKSYKEARAAWFKKPAACLLSPFEESVWIDLDCEVLACIEPIFSFLEGKEMAGANDKRASGQVNSGVLAFRRGAYLLNEWKKEVELFADKHWGDDRALAKVVSESPEKFQELPQGYNWRLTEGVPLEAKIIHYCGEWGKNYIKTYGGIKGLIKQSPLLQEMFSS